MALPERNCDTCGVLYQPKRSTSRFHSDSCRKRALRGAAPTRLRSVDRQETPAGGLLSATRAELERAGRVDTALGQAALTLAGRLDEGRDTGSAMAALSRELRAALEAATRGAAEQASPLDELRLRRLRRLGA